MRAQNTCFGYWVMYWEQGL
uniref:Uncharacterized protein n=1 Tax=Rhizophora mucronata TaxID=61149 RepID=A0A2P2Q4K5_RHIMU